MGPLLALLAPVQVLDSWSGEGHATQEMLKASRWNGIRFEREIAEEAEWDCSELGFGCAGETVLPGIRGEAFR
jgi:hypothetical protein